MIIPPGTRVLIRTLSGLGFDVAARAGQDGRVTVIAPGPVVEAHRDLGGTISLVESGAEVEASMAAAMDLLDGTVDRYIDCTPIDGRDATAASPALRGPPAGEAVLTVARQLDEMLVAGAFAIRQMLGTAGRCCVVMSPHWVVRPREIGEATLMGAAAAAVLNWATDLRGSAVEAFGLIVEDPRPSDVRVAAVIDRLQASETDLSGQLIGLAESDLYLLNSELMAPPWVTRAGWTSHDVAEAVAGPLSSRIVELEDRGGVVL